MEIKPAESKDAKEIAEISVATWKVAYKDLLPESCLAKRIVDKKRVEGIQTSIENGVVTWLKAIKNNKIIGFLSGGNASDKNTGFEYEVYSVYVLQQYWGNGAGQALFEAFKRNIGEKRFYLYALRGNKQALKFYNKLGGIPNPAFDKKVIDKDGVLFDEVFIEFN